MTRLAWGFTAFASAIGVLGAVHTADYTEMAGWLTAFLASLTLVLFPPA